jgi:hypothetical protein
MIVDNRNKDVKEMANNFTNGLEKIDAMMTKNTA